jgi:hypothetical protein
MPGTNEQSLPSHLAVMCWGIAAGIVGHPVHFALQDYPAPLIAEIFRQLLAWAEDSSFVSDFGDPHTLADKLADTRLVLLLDGKHFTRSSWQIELYRQNSDGVGRSCPSIVTNNSSSVEAAPGATLVLHGFSPQLKNLEHVLSCRRPWPPFPAGLIAERLTFAAGLEPILRDDPTQLRSQLNFRNRQILKGLLIGAAVLRQFAAQYASRELYISFDDYHEVRRALQTAASQPADASFDPLALGMVNRASAYLRMKSSANGPADRRTNHAAGFFESQLITRREIVELGKVHSNTVRQLLEFLVRLGAEGLSIFRSIGINRVVKQDDERPLPSVPELAKLLLPWSEKQTRTRFDRLKNLGLITADRLSANQPWMFRLTESLSDPANPFRDLPDLSNAELPHNLTAVTPE